MVGADAAGVGRPESLLMWFYWSLFLWPASGALVQSQTGSKPSKPALLLFAAALVIVIGLRYRIGMDWDRYLDHLLETQTLTWRDALQNGEPADGLLHMIAAATGSGIWLVNLGCATLFAGGLLAFCMRTPNPWLAFVVAMPYMTIVMAMNYTRQGAAAGLVLWALLALQHGQVRRFALLIVLAAMFHKSAALLMPLGALASTRNWFWVFLWISVASALAYVFLLAGSRVAVIDNYIGGRAVSDGANIRIAMNSGAALLYLALRKRLDLGPDARALWTRYSLITLLFIPALILSPSSTAVDRVALYFMPIQIFVLAHLPRIARRPSLSTVAVYLVVGTYAVVLFGWFNLSPYGRYWLPYRFYPFEV
jgi:hypothetical protein